ncbi:MAG: hypothetical protein ACHWZW_05340 [Spirulina sp.]
MARPLAPATPPSAAFPSTPPLLKEPILLIDKSDLAYKSDLADVEDGAEVTLSDPISEAEADPESEVNPEAGANPEPEADAEPTDFDTPDLTSEDLDLFQDPELGVIRVRNPLEDPELGILRIREQPDLPVATAPPKVAFLTARFSLVNSDNVLLVVNDVGGLTGDTFYRPAVTLAAYPSLGPETVLIGSLDAGLQRYTSQPSINYDDWRVRLALRQGLSPRSYIQVGATYQELLRAGGSRFRFFDNRAVALTLGRRDPLAPNLVLDSFYQVQWNDARSRSQTASGIVVTDFSRLGQTAGVYLGYTPSSQWHTGLSYQLNLIDYTTQDRYDTIQQLLGQVVYSITPRVRLSLYGGWSFGRSSDPRIRFGDTILGITIDATVPLF